MNLNRQDISGLEHEIPVTVRNSLPKNVAVLFTGFEPFKIVTSTTEHKLLRTRSTTNEWTRGEKVTAVR